MQYKISSVGFMSEQTYGNNNNHRVLVKFEGQDKEYSAFVKEKPSVGDVWDGELKKTEKNDKIYWNFEFARKGSGPSPVASSNDDRIYREVYATRQNLQILVQRLEEANVLPKNIGVPYPPEDVGDLPF